MTDGNEDLEWAVELVEAIPLGARGAGLSGLSRPLCEKIVAALAEPLRQSRRVEEVEHDGYLDRARSRQQRERIEELELGITEFIVELDKLMVGPSTHERGRRLAALTGQLQSFIDTEAKP